MNDFLAKHGYFLQKQGNQVIIHHKKDNYGCIHILFVVLLILSVALSIFHFAFSLILIPMAFFYFMEIDKRKRSSRNTVIDFGTKEIVVPKKKSEDRYPFSKASSVVTTSEHIGGYASADRNTTEEYRREIDVFFTDGQTLTVFSFVSDYEEEEPEVKSLIKWLEKAIGVH